MESENSELKSGDLHSVKSYAASRPAYEGRQGGVRWVIFRHKDELIEEGAIVYVGGKLIIVGEKFDACIKEGRFAT